MPAAAFANDGSIVSVAQAIETSVSEASPESAEVGSPISAIRQFMSDVEDARKITGDDPYQKRLDHLIPVVTAAFDMHAMSSAIVGRSVWRVWSPDEQNNFSSVMTEFLSATIAGRLNIETNRPTDVLEAVPGPRGSQIVRTLSTQNGEEIRVDYRVAPRGDGWAIVDIVADAKVSEVARRRAEFLGIIQAQGNAGIIAAIEKKILQLNQSGA
jgi:ABC-type transporter MlaC component